jgi:hypothetical protein
MDPEEPGVELQRRVEVLDRDSDLIDPGHIHGVLALRGRGDVGPSP